MILSDTTQLIQSLKDREPESFALLYATYGGKIYEVAYRMTGSQAEAEDITQETFLQVYRKVDDFRGQSQLYTWMYAIAKNLCYRHFQRAKKSSFASFEALLDSGAEIGPSSAIKAWEKQELVRQIKEGCLTGLVRCLAFPQRMAFILHILLHLPVRNVAEILDKSEAATKVLIHRARKNLRNFLCKNCSVYEPVNPCHCEDLLGFSLKQGWIERLASEKRNLPDVEQIEEEIKSVREVVELYTQLSVPHPPQNFNRRIQQFIVEQEGVIFASKKV
ncbi:ECF RNA polymerase sigma factor SigW [Thermoflexales bacterium]|nr:ECF RNA polymerase sigma factor SigW [Thermoflexales bacterium]